ncbi:MAG: class I SAM-dependent methyltransferase [Candidatus Sericytochromatia bacterium]
MKNFNRKEHWENIYQEKQLNEVSWYQEIPETSINIIRKLDLTKNDNIIDVGGGDSLLAENLLNLNYKNITVLDISEQVIFRAKKRLGKESEKIEWLVSDITEFKPQKLYGLWHDRATFHFLTSDIDIMKYVKIVYQTLKNSGILIIGSFSKQGPKKCSGIDIKQYSEDEMILIFKDYFKKIDSFKIDHITPTGQKQNFIFCIFEKI